MANEKRLLLAYSSWMHLNIRQDKKQSFLWKKLIRMVHQYWFITECIATWKNSIILFCLFLLPTSSRSYFPLELKEKYTHYQLSEILVSSTEKSKVGCQYVKKPCQSSNLVRARDLWRVDTNLFQLNKEWTRCFEADIKFRYFLWKRIFKEVDKKKSDMDLAEMT